MPSKNEKEYIAARAVEVMTITAIIKEEIKGQIDKQPIGDAAKKWTYDVVGKVCEVYNSQLGQGILEADNEIAAIAAKIVSEQLNKAKEE